MKTELKITLMIISLNMISAWAQNQENPALILYTSEGEKFEGEIISDSLNYITIRTKDSISHDIRKSIILNSNTTKSPVRITDVVNMSYRGYGSKSMTNLNFMATAHDMSLLVNYGTAMALMDHFTVSSDYITHTYSSKSYAAFFGYTPAYGKFRFGLLGGLEFRDESFVRMPYYDNTNPLKKELMTNQSLIPTLRLDAYYFLTQNISAGVHFNSFHSSITSVPAASVCLEFKVKFYGL